MGHYIDIDYCWISKHKNGITLREKLLVGGKLAQGLIRG